jgi:hypothetical protein
MARRNGQSVKSGERTNPEGKPVSNILLLSIPDSEYQVNSASFGVCGAAIPRHPPRAEPANWLPLLSEWRGRFNCRRHGRWKHGRSRYRGSRGPSWPSLGRRLEQKPTPGGRTDRERRFPSGGRRSPKILSSSPLFQNALTRCAVIRGMQVAQTAACNRLHAATVCAGTVSGFVEDFDLEIKMPFPVW